jgi:hypothetical protein
VVLATRGSENAKDGREGCVPAMDRLPRNLIERLGAHPTS